ncbi:MAG TPA: energy-coupling factor transporter transmembrane component T [Chloroflexota bacterium]|nr:energy-coupling factor transporter transmembrane component T [Chloroflexota bacterium]
MTQAMDWYQPGRSWLHRLDPRPKLALVLLGTVGLLSLVSLSLLLLVLVLVHLALLSAGITPRRLLRLWRILAPLLLVIVLVQPWLSPAGDPLLEIGILRLTPLGLALALALAARLAAIGFCWYTLLLTTRERDLVQGLVQLGLPTTWGLVLGLALRYPSTLQATYLTVRDAQQARGLRLAGRGLLGRVRVQFPVLIAMLVSTLRSIDHLAMALEARGFGARPTRSSLRHLHLRAADWLALAVILTATAAVLAARLFLGFGTSPLDAWPLPWPAAAH